MLRAQTRTASACLWKLRCHKDCRMEFQVSSNISAHARTQQKGWRVKSTAAADHHTALDHEFNFPSGFMSLSLGLPITACDYC